MALLASLHVLLMGTATLAAALAVARAALSLRAAIVLMALLACLHMLLMRAAMLAAAALASVGTALICHSPHL